MTIQAMLVLKELKKVQQSEGYQVSVDALSEIISTVGGDRKERIHRSQSRKWSFFPSTLRYLAEEGLLTLDREQLPDGSFTVQLTHRGFHYTQILISSLLRFLSLSIGVPILVSILTTLVTLWVKNLLGAA